MKDQSENRDNFSRNEPHFQPEGTTYFVTFRLVDPAPDKTAEQLKNSEKDLIPASSLSLINKMNLNRYGELLDKKSSKVMYLDDPVTADLVAEAIRHQHDKEYNLLAYCVMPDHVHLVFHINKFYESAKQNIGISPYIVTNILGSLKKYTAIRSRYKLCDDGETWQHESYDRVLHDKKELERVISFVLRNPIEAGFVSNWQEWRWNFVSDKFKHVLD